MNLSKDVKEPKSSLLSKHRIEVHIEPAYVILWKFALEGNKWLLACTESAFQVDLGSQWEEKYRFMALTCSMRNRTQFLAWLFCHYFICLSSKSDLIYFFKPFVSVSWSSFSLVMSEKGLLTNLAAVYLCFILFMSAVCINFLQLCNYLLTRNLFGNNWYRRINYYLQYSLYSRKSSRSQYFINCLKFSSTFEVTTEKLISTFSNYSTLFNF